jgi:DNA-directed RNA polymerase subunit beta
MFSKILRKKNSGQPEKSPVLHLSESNYRSYLNKVQVNSSDSLSLSKDYEAHTTGIFKGKPLALSRSQNKKALKSKQNQNLRNLPIKISPLKTDIKFNKVSVLKTLFSYIGREFDERTFFKENKSSEQKLFNRKKKLVKTLLSSKQSTFFKFLIVNNLTKISLKKKNYFSISPTGQLSVKSKNGHPAAKQSSAALKDVKNINFLSYVGPDVSQRTTLPKGLKFNLGYGVNSEKTIPEKVQQDTLQRVDLQFREKNVSKQHRSFKKNIFTYSVRKTFVIKKSILKLNFSYKFNWFHFLYLPVNTLAVPGRATGQTRFDNFARLELTPSQNSFFTSFIMQWKTFSKCRFNDIQGWNQGYKSSKLDFLHISPYNFQVIGQLSYVDYFINLGMPTLLASEQDSSLIVNHRVNTCIPLPLAEAKINLIGIKLRFSNNLSSKFKIQSFKFNIEKNFSLSSVTYPLAEYQRSNQDTCVTQRPIVHEGDWVQRGDLLADGTASVGGELALGKTILIAYMPWEGYNFEDAILISERLIYDDVYTSIHIERYEIEIRDTKFGVEQITKQIPEIEASEIKHLDTRGIAKIGSWIKEGDILVGKITPIQKKSLSPHEKLLYDIVKKEIPTTRDTSLRVPKSVHGRIVNIQILETENIPPEINFEGPGRVHIYIAEKRKIQVGDKMAGRHGNKGIISKILPRQDMPYLPDGTPLDMVLNPLGVPSRMNVGQVFECLLGLAGKQLGQQFKIIPFDEIYGPEASRSLVYSKLFEARRKTGQKWLFDPNFAGKTKLFDGRTGESFDQAVTVGQAYMLKLVHLVDEKIHARSTGPYSLVTQQPLRGRSKHGGQRLGEMEVWALEGFGAAYILQELLTVKSDDMKGRHQVMDAILNNQPISLGTPESFKVLIRELQSLCLDVGVYTIESSGRRKEIDVMKLA